LISALLLASCSAFSAPVGSIGSSPATHPPESAAVLFVEQTPLGGVLKSAPPDGRGSVDVLPPGTSGRTDFAASADGSVIAFTGAVALPAGPSGSTSWVSDNGVARQVDVPAVSNGVRTAWVVQPDGRAAYAAVGDSVVRYDVVSHAVTSLCDTCFMPRSSSGGGVRLAVSADERSVAITQTAVPNFYGAAAMVDVTVVDVASREELWHVRTSGPDEVTGWTFVDDDTLLTTVASARSPANAEIHRVAGLRSSHVTDTATGVHGYGPFSFVDGVWWYARDSDAKPAVTTIYVNADLTPSGERLLAVLADGPTSFTYTPVTEAPGPISIPTSSPSS
jgi:hypothetical protein